MSAPMLSLREYQREALDAVYAAHDKGEDFPAVVLPTGSGKTVIFAHMAAEHVQAFKTRVLILVHRDELADQAIAKIKNVAPHLHVGKIKAGDNEVHATIMVASVQTLARANRLENLVSNVGSKTYMAEIGLIITDEVHHAPAASYKKIYAAFPGARKTGFTATLIRGDGVGLGSVITSVAYTRSVLWMISRGYLTDVRGKAVDLDDLDLTAVKRSGGDFQAGDLGRAMIEAGSPLVVARAMALYAKRRRSIVFCPDVASAMATHKAVPYSAVVHAGTPREDRQLIYKRFRTGEIKSIINCMVLTEGADFPWADCAVIARPTSNPGLYVQMVGRVLRPFPGKEDALVLDITGTGGKLSTLIDLAPGEVRNMSTGESLGEAAVRTAEEDDAPVDSDSPAFALKHRDMDMFASSSHAWLRTPAGVMFIPVAKAEVVLWPGDDGTWDVWLAPPRGKYRLLRESLPIGSAMAWAETDAEDLMPFNGTKAAGWRKDKANVRQIAVARSLGCEVADGARKGEVSDMISIAEAAHKFDARMRGVSR